jgi:hypothetical protein
MAYDTFHITYTVKFVFRTPIVAGYDHCFKCDKFLDTKEGFDAAQLAKGEGEWMRKCIKIDRWVGR